MVHPLASLEFGAVLGDFGLDQVDVVADVHAIGHRLFVGVFGDDVFTEEAKGAFVGCCSQADQECIEVVQHLLPQVVDRAVALIDDDEIKGLDGDGRVVANRLGLFGGLLHFVE